uniref:Uncharacterized protein ORF103_2 n=1 Tax=Nothoceros aenigmaticus TaxID=13813 RepID=C3RYN5_9EMBR|nr:hypothetical protein MeaeMp29 [Nothoceros aenigmaticus]ACC86791.1 hypothetical protein MeaeMp29 [Nothoceros aenigmaticus]
MPFSKRKCRSASTIGFEQSWWCQKDSITSHEAKPNRLGPRSFQGSDDLMLSWETEMNPRCFSFFAPCYAVLALKKKASGGVPGFLQARRSGEAASLLFASPDR